MYTSLYDRDALTKSMYYRAFVGGFPLAYVVYDGLYTLHALYPSRDRKNLARASVYKELYRGEKPAIE